MSNPLVVCIAVKGTAVNGEDFAWVPSTVTIPSGKRSGKIKVKPADEAIKEDSEA